MIFPVGSKYGEFLRLCGFDFGVSRLDVEFLTVFYKRDTLKTPKLHSSAQRLKTLFFISPILHPCLWQWCADYGGIE